MSSISCRGVNMFAMLTGNLPFTVEPFNIKALHNKMLKGEMNTIPEHFSRGKMLYIRSVLLIDRNVFSTKQH